MLKDLMERTEKDWLDWLMAEVPELIHQPITLKMQYPREYRRILQVVGNWVAVESKAKRYQSGEYEPAGTLLEEMKSLTCDAPPENESEIEESKRGKTWGECSKKSKREAKVRLLSVKKIEGDFQMPEPNPRYARTKYSEIFNRKPYASVNVATKKVQMKEDEQMDEREVMTKEPEVANEGSKNVRKVRTNMTDAEMREFVLEAMKALGERPSKAEYEAYVKVHGGVASNTLVNHGLGISQWGKIAAEERVRAEVEKMTEEPVEMSEPEKILEEVPVEEVAEPKPEEAKQMEERRKDLLDILQVMIHGIDATVTIGGLEMQVRLEFGAK